LHFCKISKYGIVIIVNLSLSKKVDAGFRYKNKKYILYIIFQNARNLRRSKFCSENNLRNSWMNHTQTIFKGGFWVQVSDRRFQVWGFGCQVKKNAGNWRAGWGNRLSCESGFDRIIIGYREKQKSLR
jgi:hypothetical protein